MGISLAEIGDFPNCAVVRNKYIDECVRFLWDLEYREGCFLVWQKRGCKGLGFRPYTLLLYRAARGFPSGLSEEVAELV